MSAKHGPNRLGKYLSIHETVMGQFRDQGFVLSDSLTLDQLGGGNITIEGKIDCAHGTYIDVFKVLAVRDGDGASAVVQTVAYTYNAVLRGVGNVFRYCSAHEDHNQDHHVHRFDVLSGDVRGTVTMHGADAWPTLGEAIEELRGWCSDHAEQL